MFRKTSFTASDDHQLPPREPLISIMKIRLSQQQLVLIISFFLAIFFNATFFEKLLAIYPFTSEHIPFIGSVFLLLVGATCALLCLFTTKYTTKPLLILIVLFSSLASYFMDSYGTLIDDSMLQNIFETDVNESADLLSSKLLLYVGLLGILPAILIYRVNITYRSLARELAHTLVLLLCAVLVVAGALFLFSASYASFIREHKAVRYYANPLAYVYALGKYVDRQVTIGTALAFKTQGEDAHIPDTDTDRELIIMVVGETARADRFSLNGYSKPTNPLLEKEKVFSFSNFYSCGTSTAISVPCMFSFLGQQNFSKAEFQSSDNVLDVLKRAGVNVLWRDNNSNSKGAADRVTYQDFKAPETNPDCDVECRDIGMLKDLQAYIDGIPDGDILIVLHQMGNHGPAYYKRYPDAFEVFTPTCRSNQLEACSTEEISNTYDNAVRYTDYFLAQVIQLLKANPGFESALFYVSDHGESLGENGVYLHGLPYALAPDEQKHVAALMWFGKGMHIDRQVIEDKRRQRLNHDFVAHTLLGFMEVETQLYNPELDILRARP